MRFLFYTNDERSKEKLLARIADINDQHKDKAVAYQIEIKKNRPVRSTEQNGYYWVSLKAIANHTGYTDDELHEMYKKKFNSKQIFDEFIPRSTSDLDTLQFTVYMNKVKDHAEKMFGIKIPEPTDRKYDLWRKNVEDYFDQMYASI